MLVNIVKSPQTLHISLASKSIWTEFTINLEVFYSINIKYNYEKELKFEKQKSFNLITINFDFKIYQLKCLIGVQIFRLANNRISI